VTIDGRVAASWRLARGKDAVEVTIEPHVEIRRSARDEIRAEAMRMARLCSPEARTYDVVGG